MLHARDCRIPLSATGSAKVFFQNVLSGASSLGANPRHGCVARQLAKRGERKRPASEEAGRVDPDWINRRYGGGRTRGRVSSPPPFLTETQLWPGGWVGRA